MKNVGLILCLVLCCLDSFSQIQKLKKYIYKIKIENCRNSDLRLYDTDQQQRRRQCFGVGFKIKNEKYIVSNASLFQNCRTYDALVSDTQYLLNDIHVENFKGKKIKGKKIKISNITFNQAAGLAYLEIAPRHNKGLLKGGFTYANLPNNKDPLQSFTHPITTTPDGGVFLKKKNVVFQNKNANPKKKRVFLFFKKKKKKIPLHRFGFSPMKYTDYCDSLRVSKFKQKNNGKIHILGGPIFSVYKNKKGKPILSDTVVGITQFRDKDNSLLYGFPLDESKFNEIKELESFHSQYTDTAHVVSKDPLDKVGKGEMFLRSRKMYKALKYVLTESFEDDFYKLYSKNFTSYLDNKPSNKPPSNKPPSNKPPSNKPPSNKPPSNKPSTYKVTLHTSEHKRAHNRLKRWKRKYPILLTYVRAYANPFQRNKANVPPKLYGLPENITKDSLSEREWRILSCVQKKGLKEAFRQSCINIVENHNAYRYFMKINHKFSEIKKRDFVISDEEMIMILQYWDSLSKTKYGRRRDVRELGAKVRKIEKEKLRTCLQTACKEGCNPSDTTYQKKVKACYRFASTPENKELVGFYLDSCQIDIPKKKPDCLQIQKTLKEQFYKEFDKQKEILGARYDVQFYTTLDLTNNSSDCSDLRFKIKYNSNKGNVTGDISNIDNFVNKHSQTSIAARSKKINLPLGVYGNYESRLGAELMRASIIAFEKSI